VVVRARDASGNVEGNTVEASGTTLDIASAPFPDDVTAPIWGGGPVATRVPGVGTDLAVTWTAATDDSYDPADIRYHFCVSEVEADCIGDGFPRGMRGTSGWGATAMTLRGFVPRGAYFIVARAEDRSGNLEATGHSVQAVTATSWSRNVRPLLFDRCIACHSGADRALLSETMVEARDTVAFDRANEIVNVYGSLLDDAACSQRRDGQPIILDGNDAGIFDCQVKLIDPGHPEHSIIYRKINPIGLETSPFGPLMPNVYVGSREPRDRENFTGEEDSILRDWIEEGAVAD
jgi:hypothetical protein